MEYFWQMIFSVVLIMIVWGIVSNKIEKRKMNKETTKIFPRISDHIKAGSEYNIFLSHGRMLTRVKFVGISVAYKADNPYLPFPLSQWLIVEKSNGKRAYLKPESVRYYEDADDAAPNG